MNPAVVADATHELNMARAATHSSQQGVQFVGAGYKSRKGNQPHYARPLPSGNPPSSGNRPQRQAPRTGNATGSTSLRDLTSGEHAFVERQTQLSCTINVLHLDTPETSIQQFLLHLAIAVLSTLSLSATTMMTTLTQPKIL